MNVPRHQKSPTIGNEQGTTIIFVAMTLVVLMGFAAIAIDGAAAWALKRQDQSGADTGAIAGALFTAGRDKATAMQDAQDEIIRITYSTMTPDMTPLEWEAEWIACTDPGKPGEFTATLGSDCISFTDNLGKIRVNTPIIPWNTTFGRVIGFDRIDTRAVAEVNTELKVAGVLPFGMPGMSADESQICLKSAAAPFPIAPCDGPDTGNFGFLKFAQFGSPALGTTLDCTPDNTTLAQGIATGIDHPIGREETLPVADHDDVAACNDGNYNSRPYQVFTNPGTITGILDDGFAGDGSGLDGKLERAAEGSSTVNVRGKDLDDTPLWFYFTPWATTFCGTVATHDEMETCLDAYRDGDEIAEMFTDGIVDAPRFGWVPLFHGTDLGGGTSTRLTIKETRAIYIQTSFMGCSAVACQVEWDPGEPASLPGPGPTNIRIEAATSLNLPRTALPERARLTEPGADTQVEYLLSK